VFTGSRLSIVIPAFNEAERLPVTLHAVANRFSGVAIQIIVVDDGSTDDTAAVARKAKIDGLPVELVTLDRNRGKGAAVRAGIAVSEGDAVLIMDADLATSLDAIDVAFSRLETADIVVGSRAVPGSSVTGSSAVRAMMGIRMVRLMLQLQVHDSQCGFKMFRGDLARHLFSMSRVDGYAFDPEILRIAAIMGCSVVEIPVDWTAIEGSNIRPVRDSLKSAGALLVTFFRLRPNRVRTRARERGWNPA
jgi:dolichyl-phosphate beta-glucosyltransferase